MSFNRTVFRNCWLRSHEYLWHDIPLRSEHFWRLIDSLQPLYGPHRPRNTVELPVSYSLPGGKIEYSSDNPADWVTDIVNYGLSSLKLYSRNPGEGDLSLLLWYAGSGGKVGTTADSRLILLRAILRVIAQRMDLWRHASGIIPVIGYQPVPVWWTDRALYREISPQNNDLLERKIKAGKFPTLSELPTRGPCTSRLGEVKRFSFLSPEEADHAYGKRKLLKRGIETYECPDCGYYHFSDNRRTGA